MQTIEFNAKIIDGVIRVPEEFSSLENSSVKVVLLIDNNITSDKIQNHKSISLDFSQYIIKSFKNINPVEYQRGLRDVNK